MYFGKLARYPLVLSERLIDALIHPKHGRRVMLCILAAYTALWTTYAVVAKSTQGIHPDMAEIAAWGSNLEWGTSKHPPLLPALVWAWFSIFPKADWPYYLLAVLCASAAIYFTWLLSGAWVQGAKRAAIPFLLMLIPFYNFLALKLDHNAILIPLWAVTTYAFVRSFATRSIGWSILAGISAGSAVLAKYWSFFLLFGLAVAALVDTRRLRYLKSWAPWITALVSFCLFLPHILWLEANQYPTFVSARHRLALSWSDWALNLGGYVFGTLGYIAGPLIVLAIVAPHSRRALLDILFPRDPDRRFAAVMFWAPLLAAIPFAMITWTRLSALWSMSGLALLGVILLASPHIRFTQQRAVATAAFAVMFCLSAVIAAPLVAAWRFWRGIENDAAYTQMLAQEVQRNWDEVTTQPLRLVQGPYALSNPLSFYLKTTVLPISLSALVPARWSTVAMMDEFGLAIVCPEAEAGCRAAMDRAGTGPAMAGRVLVHLQPHWLGLTGEPRAFLIRIVPPAQRSQPEEFCCISAAKRLRPAVADLD